MAKSRIILRLKSILLILWLLSPATATASKESCQFRRALEFSYLHFPRHKITYTDHIMFAAELDETLIRLDEQGKIIRGLASEWKLDRARNEYTFKLSRDCGWSDGAKITAQDIVLGLQNLYKFGESSLPGRHVIVGARQILEEGKSVDILAVKAVDEDTVQIRVAGDPEFALKSLSHPAFSPLPSHINISHQNSPLISPERVSSGPFHVVSLNRNEVVAVRNEHYCKFHRSQIDRLHIFNNTEEYIPIREFIAGNLDIIRDISSKQLTGILDAFSESERPNFKNELTYRQVYLVINSELNGLQDTEIRAALRQGLDFPNLLEPRGMIDQFFKRADSIFFNLPEYENILYDSQPVPYEVGLKNLREIMESKGYSAQNPMKLTIKTWPIPRFVTVSKLVSSMLKPAHFNIKFVSSLSVSDSHKALIDGNYDIFIGSWVLDYLDVQNSWEGVRQIFLNAANSNVKLENYGLPANFRERIKYLNDKLERAKSTAERYLILQKLERKLTDTHTILPLYEEQTGVLYAKELTLNKQFNLYTRTAQWNNCGVSK